MDYFGILKRALKITWRYKVLWVLGLFAGTTSQGNFNNTFQQQESAGGTDPFTQWIGENTLNFAILAGVLFFIAMIIWVISLVAQGALVWGANEGAEERQPSLGKAWGVGFNKLGRTFMIGLVVGLPVLILAILIGVLVAVLGIGGYLAGDSAGAAGGALVGLCVVLPIFVILVIAISIVVGIVYPLALRYGVLHDITFGEAIKRGWYDLRGKRGAFVFWLVMILPGIAASAIFAAIMLPFFVPAFLMIMSERYVMGIGLAVLGWLVMLLPVAIYSTFVSTAWTVFFRQMTGMEVPPASYAPVGGYPTYTPPAWDNAPVPPQSYPSPAPPVAPGQPEVYAPPAPPVPPAPEPPAPSDDSEGGWPTGQ